MRRVSVLAVAPASLALRQGVGATPKSLPAAAQAAGVVFRSIRRAGWVPDAWNGSPEGPNREYYPRGPSGEPSIRPRGPICLGWAKLL